MGLRILLCDEHTLFREGLRVLLDAHAQCTVIGEASSPEQAITMAGQMLPDIILLELPGRPDRELTLISILRAVAHQSRVLMLTGCTDSHLHLRFKSLGVSGIVLKSQPSSVLFRAIQHVAAGKHWLESQLMEGTKRPAEGWATGPKAAGSEPALQPAVNPPAVRRRMEHDMLTTLTAREREVVVLLCRGLKNQEIASRLFVSEKTVRNSLTIIFSKLGVRNRLELLFYGVQQGLAQSDDSVP